MFDPNKKQHHIAYSQNFLKNPSLARYVVNQASITPEDTVVEIGPGKGILTKWLLQKTPHLVLVEKDKELYQTLRENYATHSTIKLINIDVLRFVLPSRPYKVFANPPFNILSQVVKKFAFAPNNPEGMYLFMQKEAFRRLSGKSGENQLSILLKTWYSIKELHEFERMDFSPVPSVDVSLVSFIKKDKTDLFSNNRHEYIQFVQYGYQQQKATLEKTFEKVFTHEQWKRLAGNLKFAPRAKSTDLTVEQWLGLFTYYLQGVAKEKKLAVLNFQARA